MSVITVLWTAISFVGVLIGPVAIYFAVRELRKTRAERAAFDVKNGRRILAEGQFRVAQLLLVAHWLMWPISILFFAAGVFALKVPPPDVPDAELRAWVLSRVFLSTEIIFVSAQLVLLAIPFIQDRTRRRWDAEYFIGAEASRDIKEMGETVDDTNRMVSEMQEQGTEDRPAEQTDREEGREHRGKA